MEAQEIFIVFYQQLLARTVDMPLGVGRVVWSFKKKESEESSTAWMVKSVHSFKISVTNSRSKIPKI